MERMDIVDRELKLECDIMTLKDEIRGLEQVIEEDIAIGETEDEDREEAEYNLKGAEKELKKAKKEMEEDINNNRRNDVF